MLVWTTEADGRLNRETDSLVVDSGALETLLGLFSLEDFRRRVLVDCGSDSFTGVPFLVVSSMSGISILAT